MDRRPLGDDERAIAEQIDFLNGMILLLLGVGLFLSTGGVILDIAQREGTADTVASSRSADRLADDLLKGSDPAANHLNETCTLEYFQTNTDAECGYGNFDATNESTWLRTSIGLESGYNVNATIRHPDGSILEHSGVHHAQGPVAPTDRGTVASYHRRVTFNQSYSGDTYFTLRVQIWENP